MKLEIKIKENLGLKDYLIKYYSFSFFGYLRETRAQIVCNGAKISLNDQVSINDLIIINYSCIKQAGNPCDKPIKIVYEDNDCIVVNKESGVTCIPSKLHQEDTLFNRLQYYLKDTEFSLHFINRLDKDTSGLVLVCKNQHAACLFNKVSGTFTKEYIAETYNPLPLENGIIEKPILKIDGMKRWVNEKGKYAKTEYQLLSKRNDVCRYKIILHTGLTHQIRVHLAYMGCPIIGDVIYSNSKLNSPMHLHSSYLKFYSPIKKKWIEVCDKPKF